MLPKPITIQTSKIVDLAAKTQGGPGKCNFGCLGFGSCVKSCPFQAITMSSNGLPVLIILNVPAAVSALLNALQKVLYLSDANAKIHVKCNNRAKGKAAMTNCSVSVSAAVSVPKTAQLKPSPW